MTPTAGQVRELLDYDPETGVFVWKERGSKWFTTDHHNRTWNTRYAGKKAGATDDRGYLIIGIKNKTYWAHRLAWVHFYGYWPEFLIDHADRDKSNNKIANLRPATKSQNAQNSKRDCGRTSSYTGVHWCSKSKKWWARIRANGTRLNLGRYNDEYPAALMYSIARELLHTHKVAT